MVLSEGSVSMLKERLPLIGAFCLLILTIVNYTVDSEFVTGIVGVSLFIFVLILYIVARNNKKDSES